MANVVVVLPTYNEIDNLSPMVTELLSLPVGNLRILIVDDNSPDGTGALADQLAQQHRGLIEVLHRKQKEGLGRAYVDGFKKAINMQADYIIQMDTDFSHQPKYIPQMIATARDHDMVLCSRYTQGGSVDETWNLSRKLLSWFANAIYLPTVLNIPFRDATGGYRLWKRQTLIGVDLDRIRSNGYIFQVEMVYITHRLGFKIAEFPIHFPDRKRGNSKMRLNIQLEAAVRAFQVRQQYSSFGPQMRRTKAYAFPYK